ncbi:MAG: hypothetical protein M3R06_01665 [Chloroflexota bacterium]|nr:hypothetical protein [Chloroflexota bacterium]
MNASRLQVGDTLSLIVNPATRRDAGVVIEAVVAAAPPGIQVDVRIADSSAGAIALAREAAHGARMVVAVG